MMTLCVMRRLVVDLFASLLIRPDARFVRVCVAFACLESVRLV